MTKVRILFSASQVSTLFTFTRIRVYSTLTRFITGVTSRFTVASPRVVSCVFIAMRARSSPPRRRLASSLFFSTRCAANFEHVRRKRPWSHAAIGRAQKKPRSAIGPSTFRTDERTERNRACARRHRRTFAGSHAPLAGTLCIIDLDGALTVVPFPWPPSSVLESFIIALIKPTVVLISFRKVPRRRTQTRIAVARSVKGMIGEEGYV